MLEALIEKIKQRHPGFEIRFKDEPLPAWLRLVFWFQGLITKGFWGTYTTTVGQHVYFPTREFYEENKILAFMILAHEFVHIHDAAEVGQVGFTFRYLFPQVLAPFALLGLLGMAWWPLAFLLLFVVALVPWPAPWRVKYEKRGYKMSILVRALLGYGTDTEYYVKQFTSRQYYWMSWDEDGIRKWVNDQVHSAQAQLAGIETLDRPYQDVYNVYKQSQE